MTFSNADDPAPTYDSATNILMADFASGGARTSKPWWNLGGKSQNPVTETEPSLPAPATSSNNNRRGQTTPSGQTTATTRNNKKCMRECSCYTSIVTIAILGLAAGFVAFILFVVGIGYMIEAIDKAARD
ncbi:hypothetical protein BO70DRAFT_365907 [Aspergillus heteromorphus CBS 117.55]|uniref:Uncharacterized protein n=1 Tax=Aspergillus heteromorphus CBS 117.55 TaxID=1448321 RepID=A0A317V4R5_9EURO|nr:uncharacterized protein BO70DRAFT_365907 [Aspergillus heteromorphus CBS 117.55]PWY69095.1 hypothetical protein BO70DRAFT_365907 [Aspergillus heteromorphus CBS 117.55]